MNKEKRIIDSCENRDDYWFKSWINASRKVNNLQQKIDKAIEYIEKGTYRDLYNIKSIDTLLEILGGKE